MKAARDTLRDFVRAIVESRLRETDVSDGTRVPFGSGKHVEDLEARISDLERWRDRQRRGSERRSNYARLISSLRAELRSANRYAERKAAEAADRGRAPEEDLLIDDEL